MQIDIQPAERPPDATDIQGIRAALYKLYTRALEEAQRRLAEEATIEKGLLQLGGVEPVTTGVEVLGYDGQATRHTTPAD